MYHLYLLIDTFPTQKLEFINYELTTCSKPHQEKVADAKVEDFNLKNKKSHVEKMYNFQLFVDFSTDSISPAIKFIKTVF